MGGCASTQEINGLNRLLPDFSLETQKSSSVTTVVLDVVTRQVDGKYIPTLLDLRSEHVVVF